LHHDSKGKVVRDATVFSTFFVRTAAMEMSPLRERCALWPALASFIGAGHLNNKLTDSSISICLMSSYFYFFMSPPGGEAHCGWRLTHSQEHTTANLRLFNAAV
jgi:hypothetical protein